MSEGGDAVEKGEEANWSEAVEDLVAAGDTQAAINLLQSVVSKLETADAAAAETPSCAPQLPAALNDLAALYSSLGFSLKSDQLRSRAALVKLRAQSPSVCAGEKHAKVDDLSSSDDLAVKDLISHNPPTDVSFDKSTELGADQPSKSSSDDDWEAIADREPNELLSSECLPGLSSLSLECNRTSAPKRRGRGTFSYQNDELYSDRVSSRPVVKDEEDEETQPKSDRDRRPIQSKYGTRHILVLAGFSPNTKTTDLEKLFQNFRDHVFAIRWVNDTTALAVFRAPSIAVEARDHVRCSFKVYVLDENDELLSSISMSDLEPPRERPKTSARTAQRLIAQGMGLKLPSTAFGSGESRKQEEAARRNRIITRQKLKDEAWGDD